MNNEVLATQREAEEIDRALQATTRDLLDLIKRAFDLQIWRNFGFKSWTEYCHAYGIAIDVTPEGRVEWVVDLRRHGMNTRQIAEAIGAGQRTVVRDLHREGSPKSPESNDSNDEGSPYPPPAGAEGWRAAQVHRPSTAAHAETMLRRHAYPTLGDRPLAAIRPSTVQAWVKGLVLAPSTVHVAHGIVSGIFRAAVRDPADQRQPVPGHQAAPQGPTQDRPAAGRGGRRAGRGGPAAVPGARDPLCGHQTAPG